MFNVAMFRLCEVLMIHIQTLFNVVHTGLSVSHTFVLLERAAQVYLATHFSIL